MFGASMDKLQSFRRVYLFDDNVFTWFSSSFSFEKVKGPIAKIRWTKSGNAIKAVNRFRGAERAV